MLIVENQSIEISRVVDDFHLELVSDLELFYKTEYSIKQVADCSKVYEKVYEILQQGGAVGIFPEGGSHDRGEMMPLKAGVSIMALGNIEKYPNLKLIPCGLTYFHPDRFRSRAMIEFGEPISIPQELADEYKKDRRSACSKLLDTLKQALESVTINVPDYETLQVVQATRRLYKPQNGDLSSFEQLELTRRFIKGLATFHQDPRIQNGRERILEYNKLLKAYGIRDHEVRNIKFGGLHMFVLFVGRFLLLIMLWLIGIPGRILNFPAQLVINYYSGKKAREALANSSVKITGKDVIASWKLIISLVLLPSLYLFYSLIVYSLVTEHRLLISLIALCVLPYVSFFTVKFDETNRELLYSLKPLFLSIFNPQKVFELCQMRSELQHLILHVVDTFGPQMIPDFESNRVIKQPDDSDDEFLFSDERSLFRLDMDWSNVSQNELDDVFF